MTEKTDSELVAEYLREIGKTPDGLDVKKFYDRGTMLDPVNTPGKIAFTVERHRAICGHQYIKGTPMAAYETYWPIYYYDPSERELTVGGEWQPSEKCVNVIDLVESQASTEFIQFSMEQGDEGYLCTEIVSNASEVVQSRSDVEQFALQVLNDLDFALSECEIRDCFESAEAADEAIDTYRSAWREKMLELAQDVWESRETD